MSATFKITINSVSTATINGMSDVVKQVSFDIQGSQEGQHFSLPQTVELGDPDSASFKPFSELTETDVVAWVEAKDTRLPGIKAHIQYVLDKQVAEASLQVKPLPWQPPPATVTPVNNS